MQASQLAAQRGLTLIELMVAVAIIGILAAMSVQLGGTWLNSSKVSKGQATLQQGYSVAKSAALQNHGALTTQDVAASLCVGASKVFAVLGEDCSAQSIWTGSLDKGVSVQVGNNQTCVGLNSTGVPVTSTNCGTSVDYVVAAGAVKVDNKKLY